MRFRHQRLHWPHLWLLFASFVSIGHLNNCGYQVVRPAVSQQGTLRSVAVEPFTNLTRIPMLEIRTARALRQSIIASRTFNLVQVLPARQYIQGTIQKFRQLPISFDRRDNAQQYRIEADILIRLVSSAPPHPIFEHTLTVWAEYLVSTSGDVRETAIARENAMFRLAQQFANKSLSLLTAVPN